MENGGQFYIAAVLTLLHQSQTLTECLLKKEILPSSDHSVNRQLLLYAAHWGQAAHRGTNFIVAVQLIWMRSVALV